MKKVIALSIIIALCGILTVLCVFPSMSYYLKLVYQEGSPINAYNAIKQIDYQGYGILSQNPEKYIISSHDFEKGLKAIGTHKNLTYSGEMGAGFFFVDDKGTTIRAHSRPFTLGYRIVEFDESSDQ